MSTPPKSSAVAAPQTALALVPCRQRHIDPIDAPARPLGAKRAALQLRRTHSAAQRKGPPVQAQGLTLGVLTLASQDKTVVFTLRATALGLVIERTLRPVVGIRLTQLLVFTDQPAFDRWCAFEPMRFADALLYSQLRREGHAALADKP